MVNLHKDIDGRADPENKVFYPYGCQIMPYDIPEAPAQPVVQKVEIPQVPPKEPP